ncbi:MAG TPA: methylated-DNA--[protein]-cysteine S-methyltransferase [Gaiellaceae bacterium]
MSVTAPQPLLYEIDGWGTGEVWLRRSRLLWHELPRPLAAKGTGSERKLASRSSAAGERFVRRVEAYFAGRRESFDDVDLELEGWTPFQLAVLRALRRVSWGEVVSYGELAALAGYPRAQRAVGTFCAHNRFGLVVPCHRVVGADGLGSYGSLGPRYKRRLLALEGVTF